MRPSVDERVEHLLRDLARKHRITPDGQVTLQTVACVGACSLAPVVVVDAQLHGRMTPDGADRVLDGLRAAARPAVAP